MNELVAAYIWHQLKFFKSDGVTNIISKVSQSLGEVASSIVENHGF